MVTTYRAPFSHWADFTFAELAEYPFELLAEPSHVLELSASIVLAPLTDDSPRKNHIITPRLIALANQFSYVLDLNYKMGLLRRIEFATGHDLDDVWGRIYEVRRRYAETDDEYRKRLQVYLLQVAGSGTKAAVEEIISIICEWPNSCRVDTYWPGYCRVYITNAYARQKARDRQALIDLVLPNTLAAGVDYRFYIPYVDIPADIVLQGPELCELPADIALQSTSQVSLDTSLVLGIRHTDELEADIRLAYANLSYITSRLALRDEVQEPLEAQMALMGEVQTSFEASEALMGAVENSFDAYARVQAEAQTPLSADMWLQGKRLRPIEARINLVEA
jgi:hypothetical protein